jgi:F0F1-type ATP synthase assembly protein I
MEQKRNAMRGNIAFAVAIIAGYLLGFLIKKVHIGLILGLIFGLAASFLIKRR